MATKQLQTNVKVIKSNTVPTAANLPEGNLAFGEINGTPKLFGNSGNGVREYGAGSGGGSGGEVSLFDIVIRTQAEFYELIISANWLGAKSVAFIGNGGTLKFSHHEQIVIPPTVRHISGFNNAIIVSQVVEKLPGLTAFFGYNGRPTVSVIENINLEAIGDASAVYGFWNCINLINCQVKAESPTYNVYGFYICSNLVNCTATSSSNSTVSLYRSCSNLANCNAKYTYATTGSTKPVNGFYSCSYLVNCTSDISAHTTGWATAYEHCGQLSNCSGSARNAGTVASGFTFYSCEYTNGCREAPSASTGSNIWNGINTFRDDQSCQTTRSGGGPP